MYLPLNGPRIFVVSGDIDPQGFFPDLASLFPNGLTITALCYERDRLFAQLAAGAKIVKHSAQFDFRTQLAIWNDEYPDAVQLDFVMTEALLHEIDALARKEPKLLPSDHLFLYDPKEVWLSFHDSFCGGDIHVSTRVDRDRLVAFGSKWNAKVDCVLNPCV